MTPTEITTTALLTLTNIALAIGTWQLHRRTQHLENHMTRTSIGLHALRATLLQIAQEKPCNQEKK